MNIKSILVIALIIVSSMAGAMGSEESENLRAVQQAIIDAGADWDAGITSMSGLTDVEKRLLALPDPIPEPDGMIVTAPAMRALQHEERFDWRDTGKVTPVRHQGSCGSCWAFGAIGAVESAFLIHTEKNLDLSEQHLVSSCCNAGSCNGGWPDWALDYIRNTGVPDETCYPYKARNTACDPCAGWEDRAYKIKDHVYVEPSTDDFKWALKEYGPISVVLEAGTIPMVVGSSRIVGAQDGANMATPGSSMVTWKNIIMRTRSPVSSIMVRHPILAHGQSRSLLWHHLSTASPMHPLNRSTTRLTHTGSQSATMKDQPSLSTSENS
jgi:hypothetical protein